MAKLEYYDVILEPVITEKTMDQMGFNKYTFYVHPEATKTQVREAVEKMFNGTEVKKVNIMNVSGKKKRQGYAKFGKRKDRKKAIVTLTETSEDIEIFQTM